MKQYLRPAFAPALLAVSAVALIGAGPQDGGIISASEPSISTPLALPIESPVAFTDVIATDADRYLRMTVPVSVEGEGPFRFMVDTGSQATAVTREMSESLALAPAGTATLIAMASRREVDLVRLDGLEVGTSIFDGIDAPVLERRNVGADGIIGLDNLQDFRVLLDFRENTMSLTEGEEARSRRGFEIIVRAKRNSDQLVITEALVEGIRTVVIIDTGAQGTIGNMALQRRIRSRRQGDMTLTDINGITLAGQYSIVRKLQIDTLQLQNLVISHADTPAFAALGYTTRPALLLGMDHLRMFDRVAIDFDKKRVLFDMPRGARRDSRRPPTLPR